MTPKRIILHHSATADSGTVSWQAIRKFHTSYRLDGRVVTKDVAIKAFNAGKQIEAPWSDIGYHFGIELVNEDYEVLVGRMLDVTGAHCHGENSDSLGVCFIGDFDAAPVPVAQWLLGIKLVRGLCRVLDISAQEVYGHRDFSTKTCPGKLFDLEAFRNAL